MIDAHSHVWSADLARFPLAPGKTASDLAPPTFRDDELMAVAGPFGVDRVVLIQHTIYHRFDNATLLDAVRRHPERFRAVGMIDEHEPDPGAEMRRLLPLGVSGFRITPFLRAEEPAPWLASPGMQAMWATAAETRQPMCCLVNPDALPAIDAQCERFPDTPVVIDHFARVGGDGHVREDDLARLCGLARHAHTFVKVSGFYALGRKEPPYHDVLPMLRRVYDAFGPRRLMWGSDCPYQIQPGHSYAASIDLIRDGAGFLTGEDRRWILNDTADRVFCFAAPTCEAPPVGRP